MKIGFEREFFVKRRDRFVLCPSDLPADECGYLAESRGEPHSDALKAAFLLLATEFRMRKLAQKLGLRLYPLPTAVIPPILLREAIRKNGKPVFPLERGNIYGNDYEADDSICRAGMHVHFSNQITFDVVEGGKTLSRTYNGFLDIPKLVHSLDVEFSNEIREAERISGCYEIKVHGFEYRSLPASIDPIRVAEFLSK